MQTTRRVAKNSQWVGRLGGLGAEPSAAGRQWGSEGEVPSWGRNPQRSKILHFLAKITEFWSYSNKK